MSLHIWGTLILMTIIWGYFYDDPGTERLVTCSQAATILWGTWTVSSEILSPDGWFWIPWCSSACYFLLFSFEPVNFWVWLYICLGIFYVSVSDVLSSHSSGSSTVVNFLHSITWYPPLLQVPLYCHGNQHEPDCAMIQLNFPLPFFFCCCLFFLRQGFSVVLELSL